MGDKTMNATKLAWAAGYIDGDGSIYAQTQTQRGKKYLRLVLAIGQSEEGHSDLYRMSEIFGGNVTGPYKNKGTYKGAHNSQDTYLWGIYTTPKVIQILHLLWPYLGLDKKRKAIIAYRKVRRAKRQQERYHSEIFRRSNDRQTTYSHD
jgi:hypothetical protein